MNPLAIYQNALDAVSRAILAGDFDAYTAMIDLPYMVRTETADLLITTEAELRPTFDALHNGLLARGVTHYERVARLADYRNPNCIEGWHFTHMLKDGSRILPPRPARQAIVRRGDVWRFSEARYPIDIDTWPMTESALFDDPVHMTLGVGFRP
jgi:hypothetical protein